MYRENTLCEISIGISDISHKTSHQYIEMDVFNQKVKIYELLDLRAIRMPISVLWYYYCVNRVTFRTQRKKKHTPLLK